MLRRILLTLLTMVLTQPNLFSQETMAKLRISRDLEYASVDGQSLQLDLYELDDDQCRPLVVWIHGGGWRGGSRAKPPIRRIVESGYALASISYRFTDRAIFPAQIHDCKAAIRWLRANAANYHYLADWIAVAGSSAGGHLALLVGMSAGVKELEGDVGGNLDESSAVHAIVDYFGPSDFVLRGRTQSEMAYSSKAGSYALLGGRDGKIDPELERLASPSEYVSDKSPPLLIFHGTEDSRVLMDQSERMVELYTKHKLPVELIRVEGAGHGGMDFFMTENFQRVVAFLDANKPQPAPTPAVSK